MISLTNHDFQWGRSEVVIIYPDTLVSQWKTVVNPDPWILPRCRAALRIRPTGGHGNPHRRTQLADLHRPRRHRSEKRRFLPCMKHMDLIQKKSGKMEVSSARNWDSTRRKGEMFIINIPNWRIILLSIWSKTLMRVTVPSSNGLQHVATIVY